MWPATTKDTLLNTSQLIYLLLMRGERINRELESRKSLFKFPIIGVNSDEEKAIEVILRLQRIEVFQGMTRTITGGYLNYIVIKENGRELARVAV